MFFQKKMKKNIEAGHWASAQQTFFFRLLQFFCFIKIGKGFSISSRTCTKLLS